MAECMTPGAAADLLRTDNPTQNHKFSEAVHACADSLNHDKRFTDWLAKSKDANWSDLNKDGKAHPEMSTLLVNVAEKFHSANGTLLEYNSNMHAFTNQGGDSIYNAQSNSFSHLSQEQQTILSKFNSGPDGQRMTKATGGYHIEVNNGHLQAIGDIGPAVATYNSQSKQWEVANTANHVPIDKSYVVTDAEIRRTGNAFQSAFKLGPSDDIYTAPKSVGTFADNEKNPLITEPLEMTNLMPPGFGSGGGYLGNSLLAPGLGFDATPSIAALASGRYVLTKDVEENQK